MLHNYFTLRGRTGTVTAFNSLSILYTEAVKNYPNWARYLCLCDESGKVVGAFATLKFVNDDPSRGGEMRAVYTASVKVNPNTRYVKVSLGWAINEKYGVSSAEIDYLAEDEMVDVTATLFLSVNENENIALCGGSNALVRHLLGCESKVGSYYLGYGDLSYPPSNAEILSSAIQYKVSTNFNIDGENITFESRQITGGKEIALLCDGVPVIRALRPYERDVLMFSGTIDSHCGVLISSDYAEELISARVENDYLIGADVLRKYDGIVAITSKEAVNLGVEGDVKSDPAGEYLLITTSAYAEVYRVKGCNVQSLLRVRRQYEHTDVMLSGCISLWSADTLTIYERNSATDEYTSRSYSLKRGDGSMVFHEGSNYHAVTIDGGYVKRYKISGANAVMIENYKISGNNCFLSKCGNIAIWADNNIYAKSINNNLSSEFAFEHFSSADDFEIRGIGNGFAIVYDNNTQASYTLDFIHNTKSKTSATLVCNGSFAYDKSTFYLYDYYNGLRSVRSAVSAQDIYSACTAGDMIWAVKDKKLYCYCMSGTNLTVRMKHSDIGKKYYCSTAVRNYKGVGKQAKITLRLV